MAEPPLSLRIVQIFKLPSDFEMAAAWFWSRDFSIVNFRVSRLKVGVDGVDAGGRRDEEDVGTVCGARGYLRVPQSTFEEFCQVFKDFLLFTARQSRNLFFGAYGKLKHARKTVLRAFFERR